MNMIRSLFVFELKRRLKWREITVVFAVLLIFLFFINQGKNKYTDTIDNTSVFQETEERLVKSYIHYTQYGTIGIRLLFIPSPFSILYHNPIYEGLLSSVNSGEKLTLDKTLKGRHFFVKTSPFNDFLSLVLLCAAVFCVLYGYDTPREKAYLRFLSSLSHSTGKGTAKLFAALAIARLMLAMLIFFLLLAVSLFWAGIHNVHPLQTPVVFFILLIFITIVFFFFVGFLLGTLRKKASRAILLGVFYAASFIILPVLFNIYTDINVSQMESLFEFELKNMELVMLVEKRLIEKFGFYKSGDVVTPELKEKIKEALSQEFNKVFAREEHLKELILEKVSHRHGVSCLYPVLFFNTAVGELSSCGELSVLDFYSYSLRMKKEFLSFYVEKKFMLESRPGHVENFIKGGENLFYAQSLLPYHFWWGTAVSLLYIALLAMASYFRFKRVLAPAPEKGSTDMLEIHLCPGEDYHVNSEDYAAVDHFYSVFSGGVKDFTGKIIIDGKNIASGEKQEFVYLCSLGQIPGEVKVNAHLRLYQRLLNLSQEQTSGLKAVIGKGMENKRFLDLPTDEKLQLMFKLVQYAGSRFTGRAIYMLHDFVSRCSAGYVKELAEEISRLKSKQAIILYFKDGVLCKQLNVDHHNVYTRTGHNYEWHEVRG